MKVDPLKPGPPIPAMGLLLSSTLLSGAEKRFVRIFLEGRRRGMPLTLVVNRTLWRAITGPGDFAEAFAGGRWQESVLVYADLAAGPMRSVSTLLRALHLHRACRRRGLQGLHAALAFRLAAWLARWGWPVVFEVTSPDVARGLTRSRRHRTTRSFRRLVAVSASVHSLLREASGLSGSVWPPIVEAPIPFFVEDETVARTDTLPKERLVVFASRLIPRKNPVLFARVAVAFLERCPDWRVAILGAGPEETTVREILGRYRDTGRVELGHVPSIYPHLVRSQVFVSIIERDNYPSQSVLEAMSSQNALLLSRRGQSGRFLDGTNGVLVDLDESALVAALVDLVSDPGRLRVMGEGSRRWLRTTFPVDTYLDHLRRLYTDALAHPA